VQLESLQSAANVAADIINARGSPIDVRLQDILACVQDIALHGVHHGAVVALTTAQVQTGHDLHTMEVGFLADDGPEGHEDLIEDFTAAAEAIVDVTPAQDVVNKIFD